MPSQYPTSVSRIIKAHGLSMASGAEWSPKYDGQANTEDALRAYRKLARDNGPTVGDIRSKREFERTCLRAILE